MKNDGRLGDVERRVQTLRIAQVDGQEFGAGFLRAAGRNDVVTATAQALEQIRTDESARARDQRPLCHRVIVSSCHREVSNDPDVWKGCPKPSRVEQAVRYPLQPSSRQVARTRLPVPSPARALPWMDRRRADRLQPDARIAGPYERIAR